MIGRLLPLGKSFENCAVYQEYVEPAVVVIVIESNAAACSLKQVLVLVLAAEDRLDVESRFLRYIHERDAEISAFLGSRVLQDGTEESRKAEAQNVLKR